ncbi:phospholipase A2 inhibitor gamma subunit B-like [Podarcis muralis]
MKIFLSTCLFLAILSEVTAERCKVKKLNDRVAQGTCETSEGGSCFNRVVGRTFNGSTKFEIEMGCTTDCTSRNYIFTSGKDYFLRQVRFCCRATDCYKKLYEMEQPELNGQECPTCFPSFSKACKGSKTIKCYDDQTQCIEFVVDHDDSAIPDKHFYGCASPTFCAMAKNSTHFDVFSGTITKARCCDTSASPRAAEL